MEKTQKTNHKTSAKIHTILKIRIHIKFLPKEKIKDGEEKINANEPLIGFACWGLLKKCLKSLTTSLFERNLESKSV